MGTKGGNSWFSTVKQAFRSPPKDNGKRSSSRREENEAVEEEEEDKKRGKRRWIFLKPICRETTIQHKVSETSSSPIKKGQNLAKKQAFESRLRDQRRAIALAMATTAAAESAVATAQAAVEIIRLATPTALVADNREQTNAALVIQTAFRGYLARRALFALKGIVKLQALVRGHNIRNRAKLTLRCIESLVRVQARVCEERRRLSFEETSPGSTFYLAQSVHAFSTNDSHDPVWTRQEIQALIRRGQKCSLEQILKLDDDQQSIGESASSSKKIAYQRDSIKNLFERDTYSSSEHHHMKRSLRLSHSPPPQYREHQNVLPHSTSSSKYKQLQFTSPRCQREEKNYRSSKKPALRPNNVPRTINASAENSGPVPPRPNFMAATASTTARLRSHSVPRLRSSSPNREQTLSVRKRLSFVEGDNIDGNTNTPKYSSIYAHQLGLGRICNVSS
ncbi:IQ-domain 17 [Dorcoceras hygrometricum]|uniref:IQ-domain 17 n=1 Tax=Dorcoceras hygrometricum TaxID=472368 RepID=A0A2Z7C8F8_9LAMI|nr:IQ-domain 17 [Dorcoceras hygrometricum]